MHGNYTAITAMQRADLLVAVGVRFDDRVTGDVASFAPQAKVIHVDVDPAEIGKVRVADIPIVGDARAVLIQLIAAMERLLGDRPAPDRSRGWRRYGDGSSTTRSATSSDDDGPIKPQFVIEELHASPVVTPSWSPGSASTRCGHRSSGGSSGPARWINSGGLGTMGFAVPAAIGAKTGVPDQIVYAIDGDGCFQMTLQELITAAIEEIPIKVAVINNGARLGWSSSGRGCSTTVGFSAVDLSDHTPDYPKLAEAMGCVGLRADTPDEVAPAIEKSLAVNDRPVVVEFVVDPDEMVFPMVPAGGSNDDVILGPDDLAPSTHDTGALA